MVDIKPSSKHFTFSVNGYVQFQCALQSHRCVQNKSNGQRCKLRTVIGTNMCWRHLLTHHNLRIKESGIPGAGKGLFAMSKQNEIVFRKGDVIIEYLGEVITKNELDGRYGEYTAPYALQETRNRYLDSACNRGIASLANRPPVGQSQMKNAEFVYDQRAKKIYMVSTRDILNGSEILVSYGRQYRLHETGITYATH